MKPTLKAGLVLGILVVAWTFVMGVTGWYKDPVKLYLFYIVVLIEIAVLIWGLRLTAREGKTYGGQVAAGTLMAVIGAVVIFFGSLLFTTVIYPNYFAELRDIGRQALMAQGMSAEQAEAQLKLAEPTQTPFMQALIGAVMTVVTGFVASLVIATVLRKKPTVQA
jgi:hypothetical protein